MVKRRKVRRTSTALSEDRQADLIGGMFVLLTGQPARDELFDSDLQRRAVYFANKEKLIDEAFYYFGPGARPDAFYDYETDLDIGKDPDQLKRHKYLIDNNLFFEGELPGMIAAYLFIFEKVKNSLKNNSDLYNLYRQRAQIYGGAAVEAWDKYFNEA